MKRFENPEQYSAEIHRLVPGYSLVQELLPAIALAQRSCEATRTLCVGVGTGVEAELLLRMNERDTLVALDPSAQMCRETTLRLERSGLSSRANVQEVLLADYRCDTSFNLITALLVAHFLPDDGARGRLFYDLARCLAPNGRVLVVEIDALASREQLRSYELWAAQRGLSPAGIETLRRRLTREFHTISPARFSELASRAGLEVESEFMRVLNVVGYVLRHRSPVDET